MEWRELVGTQPRNVRSALEREGQKGRYATITLSLTTAETDALKEINGDYIGIASITGDGTCKVRLDHRHAQELDLRQVSEISSPFGKIYFTTDGAGGSVVLLIGGALTARIKPIQSKMSLRSVVGVDIDPVQDKRFIAHAGAHLKITLSTADTAERIIAASTKVRWAIIGVGDYDCRWGFSSTVARATAIGQKVAKNGYITVEHCNLNEIYFVNADAGAAELPVLNIEYITEA